MPDLIPLLRQDNEKDIEEYLRSQSTFVGGLCVVLLQAVQIISIILPGAPIQIAAGVIYGTLKAFILCHTASVATHVTVFYCARNLGDKLNKIAPTEHKISKLDFLLKSDLPWYMTTVAYLMPLLPNGIIAYVAAKTDITLGRFAVAAYVGNIFSILILCAIGSSILAGDYTISVVLLAVLFAVVILLWKYKDEVLGFLKKRFPSLH